MATRAVLPLRLIGTVSAASFWQSILNIFGNQWYSSIAFITRGVPIPHTPISGLAAARHF